jgi:streptomycin 6-kinase
MELEIPAHLAVTCREDPDRAKWLARLPDLVRQLAQGWELTLGVPFDGEEVSCALVAPVTLADGRAAVLKFGMPHMEGEDEIEGLRFWDGEPTVKLLDYDRSLNAMLLEKCEPGTVLRTVPEDEQDVVIARMLRRLWRSPAAPHAFRPLSTMIAHWIEEAQAASALWTDPCLVGEGLRLFRELLETVPAEVLLATDLHAGNVLRARREPWLVIDPKPFVGDPAYDATQHLLNCRTRLLAEPDRTIRRFAELLGVDHERVRLWTFARTAVESHGAESAEVARALAP